MNIAGREIERVVVIDDDAEYREVYGYPIEDLGLEPVYEKGPLEDVETSLREFRRRGDAIVCDYHLQIKNFSKYNGDQLVASSNSTNFPALLCSNYSDTDIMVLRSKRRFIPALLEPATYSPETIRKGFERCLQEGAGQFVPSRKPWRTLVRVVEVEESHRYFYVVVPGWNADQKLRIYFEDLPPELVDSVRPLERFFAQVNTGAELAEELYFDVWEKPKNASKT